MTVSMSAVWDRTSEFLGRNMAAVAAIAAVTMFVPTLITEVLAPLGESGGTNLKWGLAALSLALAILTLWGQLVITGLALDPTTGAATNTAVSRDRATRRLPTMIGVMLVVLAIGLLLVSPILATLINSGIDLTKFGQPGASTNLSPGAAGFVGFYALFVVLPVGLFLMARLGILSVPVVVAEEQGVIGNLTRSFQLSRGLVWKIIGVMLLYLIIMFVATLAAGAVLGSLFRFLLPSTEAISVASVLTAIVTAAVGAVFSVIPTAFCTKLYMAARDREVAVPA